MTQPTNDQPAPQMPQHPAPKYGPPPPNAPMYQPYPASHQPGVEEPIPTLPPTASEQPYPAYPAPAQPGLHPDYPVSGYPVPAYPPQYQPLPTPTAGGLFDGAQHPGQLLRPLYGAHMGHAIARFFKSYANFSGRASRSEFWWMVLAYWGTVFALAMIGAGLGEASYSMPYEVYSAAQGLQTAVGLLLLLLFLGTIVPWLALTWRRLHDANLPGPFYFFNLIPYLGWIPVMVFTVLPSKPEGRRFDKLFY